MGIFSKKEKIPEIPPAPRLPELPGMEKNELPHFPYNLKENLNQEIVKSAVSDSGENEVEVEEFPQDFNFQGIPPVPSMPVHENRETFVREFDEKEPIFVRIDKFQAAQKDFEEIKKRMGEIESTLGKIKDIKSKEDSEISSWNEDIEKIKSRLSEIDENIFNKI